MFVRRRDREPARVDSVEGIMSGTPCVLGTRVPAETICAYLRGGYSDLEIFEDYPSLPPDGIRAVRDWADRNGIDTRPEAGRSELRKMRRG